MKKLFICLSLLLVLSLVIVGAASSCAPKETKVLRLSYPLPEFDPTVVSAQQAADDFNAAAKGAYKIEVYPGGVLGASNEVFDMVREGAVDLCDFAPDYMAVKDQLFAPQTLPFAFEDKAAGAKFLELIVPALWEDIWAETYNVKLLSLTLTSGRDWSGTKPIHTLEDWEGKVVWVSGPVDAEAVEALGSSGVMLDWNDGYPAMEKGVVDGHIYGHFAVWMLKWEACRYVTVADMMAAAGSGAVFMTLDTFNAMPKNLQETLVTAFKGHETRMRDYFVDIEKQAAAELEQQGVEIYHLPEAERARWVDATKSVIDDYLAQLSPADAKSIQDLMAEANR